MTEDCKLCQKSNSDLRRSHIIYEFNYTACYDQNRRFIRISNCGPKHQKSEQKGYREYLLYQQCETTISVWEKHATEVLADDGLHLISRDDFGYVLGGLDYAQFKLYGMSILWRMGVSSLPMFNEVRLGRHEELLREALMRKDPLNSWQYPFLLTAFTINGKFSFDIVVPPSLAKTDGYHVYRCVLGGIIYSFIVGGHKPDRSIQEMAVSPNGTIVVAITPIENVPFLTDHLEKIYRATSNTSFKLTDPQSP